MKQITFRMKGNAGDDYMKTIDARPGGALLLDKQMEPYAEGLPVIEDMRLLPVITTVVATSAKLVLAAGTNATNGEVTKEATGGVNLVTAGADDDQTYLKGIAETGFEAKIRPASQIVFRTQVQLAAITAEVASAGLNENPTDPDPSATAGEGATFVFCPYAVKDDLTVDPTVAGNGGITEAQMANWMIHEKVNGVDTYYPTDVQVVAGQDYELVIAIGKDLKPLYYIDGVLVRTGDTALTADDKLFVLAGIQALAIAAKTMIIRYLSLSRLFG